MWGRAGWSLKIGGWRLVVVEGLGFGVGMYLLIAYKTYAQTHHQKRFQATMLIFSAIASSSYSSKKQSTFTRCGNV